jgi:hypothetical protein
MSRMTQFQPIARQFHIRHKARRVHRGLPRCQIPNTGFQPVGNQPHKQCETETGSNGSYQGETMGMVMAKITARGKPPPRAVQSRQAVSQPGIIRQYF